MCVGFCPADPHSPLTPAQHERKETSRTLSPSHTCFPPASDSDLEEDAELRSKFDTFSPLRKPQAPDIGHLLPPEDTDHSEGEFFANPEHVPDQTLPFGECLVSISTFSTFLSTHRVLGEKGPADPLRPMQAWKMDFPDPPNVTFPIFVRPWSSCLTQNL